MHFLGAWKNIYKRFAKKGFSVFGRSHMGSSKHTKTFFLQNILIIIFNTSGKFIFIISRFVSQKMFYWLKYVFLNCNAFQIECN